MTRDRTQAFRMMTKRSEGIRALRISALKSSALTNKENVEMAIQYAYFLSVALAPLGPVAHYSPLVLSALLLVYNVLRNGASFRLERLSGTGRKILLLFFALAVWTAAVALLTFTDLRSWGKNITVPIELFIGAYFAARTMNSDAARAKFIKIFVAASFIILLGNLLRLLGILPFFPNRALANGNSLGALGLLLFPPMACFVCWVPKDTAWKRILFLLPLMEVILFSFSSGVWLSVLLGGIVFLHYAFRFGKISWKYIILAAIIFVASAFCIDAASQGRFAQRLAVELRQLMAFNDLGRLTTRRNLIWKASLYMIRQRPMTGSGGEAFEKQYARVRRKAGKKLGLNRLKLIDHPHSTYLYLAYIGGVPALILFLAAIFLCFKKVLRLAREEKDAFFPWAVMSVIFLIEILTYGTNGDVFQGRRDISAVVWCFLGIMIILPDEKMRKEMKMTEKNADAPSKKPCVSIIIPVFNAADRLKFMVESLRKQDYPELEIIFCDDASTDGSFEYLEELRRNRIFPNMNILHNEENKGVSFARNRGLSVAQGEYVVFVDADDMLEPNFISLLYAAINAAGSDYASCGYKNLEAATGAMEDHPLRVQSDASPEEVLCGRILNNKINLGHWATLYRKDFLTENSLSYTEGCTMAEDEEFLIKMLCCLGRGTYIDDCLYIYVQHGLMGLRKSRASREKKISRYRDHAGALMRSAMLVAGLKGCEKAQSLARSFMIPVAYQRCLSSYAMQSDRKKFTEMLADPEIRSALKGSWRAIFIKPEVFVRSCMCLYFSEVYFKRYLAYPDK